MRNISSSKPLRALAGTHRCLAETADDDQEKLHFLETGEKLDEIATGMEAMGAREYNELLEHKLFHLILSEDDPQTAMKEIAEAAERGGLIDNSNSPNRTDVGQFLRDLLIDNPHAGDWMRCRLETMPHTLQMSGISEIAEHLM